MPKDRDKLERNAPPPEVQAQLAGEIENDDELTPVGVNQMQLVGHRLKRLSTDYRELKEQVRSLDEKQDVQSEQLGEIKGEMGEIKGEMNGLKSAVEASNEIAQAIVEQKLSIVGDFERAHIEVGKERAKSLIEDQTDQAKFDRKWKLKWLGIFGTIAAGIVALIEALLHG